ncbi:ribosome maturation factor RimM [Massilia sp. W12]|uniref:ribosome maturation factor RimM n=1 Tax=Massilia sp. W12 TaxID=3126507 RepID=UPI0030D3411F
MQTNALTPPADLVLVGHVTGAFGVQGWVKIRPYSSDADAMFGAKTWWLDKPQMQDVDVRQVKQHGADLVALFTGIAGRDGAEALKGAQIMISRSRFPALSDGEYYWTDLIGMQVVNLQGQVLGQVADMMDNGAHPILRLTQEGQKEERLIPFVDQFVREVDLAKRQISADWELDF